MPTWLPIASLGIVIALLMSYLYARCTGKRWILAGMSCALCMCYALWRITAIPVGLGLAATVVGSILFVAELLGICSFFAMVYLFMGTHKPPRADISVFKEEPPRVDVLICTYNEPLYLLRMIVAASCNIDYPAHLLNIYVCDDGRRKEVRKLCTDYGVGYITRPSNEGAKAGNINNALNHIDGELFLVLDADMIPRRDFLTRTVGCFVDPRVAFVQTPQVYYNQDMYQYNLARSIPNEQDFFMREVQRARASREAVLHVGTNAVFRRSAVLEVGGYPTSSITEDMALGKTLQTKFESVFVNEELAFGLSATTFSELVKQRDRWCRGNLQVLKTHNPLTLPGLSVAQRIAYVDGIMYWFGSVQKMIYLVCPVLFFLTGIVVINAPLVTLTCMFIPYLLGQWLMFSTLTSNLRGMRWSHYYETAMAPHLCVSIFKELFGIQTGFNVTTKDLKQAERLFDARIVAPHGVLLLLTVAGWVYAGLRIASGAPVSVYLANVAWSAYNALALINAIRVANQRPLLRSAERIAVRGNEQVDITGMTGRSAGHVVDISGEGLAIELDAPFETNAGESIELHLAGTVIACEVVRFGQSFLAVRYLNPSAQEMRALMRLFQDNLVTYHSVAQYFGGSRS